MNRIASIAAVFVIAFVLSTSLVLAGGAILGDDDPAERLDGPDIALDDVGPETAASGGDITVDADEDGTVVIHAPMMATDPADPIDIVPAENDPVTAQVTGADQLDRDLEPLVSALAADGHDIVIYDGMAGALEGQLMEATGFLTLAPEDLSSADRDAVHDFVDRDGHAIIATNPDDSASISTFTGSEGITQQPGFVYDVETNDRNYLHVLAEATGDASITDGVGEAVFRSPAPLETESGIGGMTTADTSERSIDQEAAPYDVVAQSDTMVVLADASFMAPEFADRADNDILISNIGTFLATGAAETEDPPDVEEQTLIEPIEQYYEGLDTGDHELLEGAVHPDSEIIIPAAEDLEAMSDGEMVVTNLVVDQILADRAYVDGTEEITDPETGEITEWDMRVEVRPVDDPEEDEWLVFDFHPAT